MAILLDFKKVLSDFGMSVLKSDKILFFYDFRDLSVVPNFF